MKKILNRGLGVLSCVCLLLGAFSVSWGDDTQSASEDALAKLTQKVERRDSWGFLEFLHFHSEAAKQKEAKSIIHDLIRGQLDMTGSMLTTGGGDASGLSGDLMTLMKQMDMVYGDSKSIPTDAYRSAVQEVLDQDVPALKQKYPKLDTMAVNLILVTYYDQGKGPATVTVDSMEKMKKSEKDMQKAVKQLQDTVNQK